MFIEKRYFLAVKKIVSVYHKRNSESIAKNKTSLNLGLRPRTHASGWAMVAEERSLALKLVVEYLGTREIIPYVCPEGVSSPCGATRDCVDALTTSWVMVVEDRYLAQKLVAKH